MTIFLYMLLNGDEEHKEKQNLNPLPERMWRLLSDAQC